jgi:hypothetical protein
MYALDFGASYDIKELKNTLCNGLNGVWSLLVVLNHFAKIAWSDFQWQDI